MRRVPAYTDLANRVEIKPMYKTTCAVLTTVTVLLAAPSIASAESWICEHSNLVREINVEREADGPAPCSVVYNKDSEGQGSTVLWTARNDGAYCEEKANGLAEKLQGYGWACTAF